MEINKQKYQEYVKEITPKNKLIPNMAKAFLVGGMICFIGQAMMMGMENFWGMEQEEAAAWTQIELIFASVLLTGFNLYSKLAKWGGAGALVPITGFANSVVSPAIEYQVEGQVYGIGCKIFTIAGSVILYGVFTSWILGVIMLVLKY